MAEDALIDVYLSLIDVYLSLIDVYVNVNIKEIRDSSGMRRSMMIGRDQVGGGRSGDDKLAVTMETTTFGIGDLVREFGITARAIRFYEDRGLIMPVRTGRGNRVRVYSQRDRARLTLLLRGKRLGLSLADIKSLLDMYETPADSEPQLVRFLALLDEHRLGLQRQLTDLNQVLVEIDQQREHVKQALSGLPKGGRRAECRITVVPPTAAAAESMVETEILGT